MLRISLLVLLAAAAATAAAGDLSLYYVDLGSRDPAPGCDPKPCPPPPPPRRQLRQAPMLPFFLVKATYGADGGLKGKQNLTAPMDGMGYVSVHPGQAKLLMATERTLSQGWKNVDTFVVEAIDTATPAKPTPWLSSTSELALLTGCTAAKPFPCTQVSTFHAQYTPDGKQVVFAYSAWTTLGDRVGNQALAVADADGSNAVALSYNVSDTQTADMCPTVVGDQLIFVRGLEQGMHDVIGQMPLSGGGTPRVLASLPASPAGAGCPAWLGAKDADSFMYLGCNSPCGDDSESAEAVSAEEKERAMRWGESPRRKYASGSGSAAKNAPFSQMLVTLAPDSAAGAAAAPVVAPMFDIYTTTAPGYVGVFETSQCDRPHGAPWGNQSAICQGADPSHLFFMKFGVDAKTGVAARNDTDTVKAVMTPRPWQLWSGVPDH